MVATVAYTVVEVEVVEVVEVVSYTVSLVVSYTVSLVVSYTVVSLVAPRTRLSPGSLPGPPDTRSFRYLPSALASSPLAAAPPLGASRSPTKGSTLLPLEQQHLGEP
jgi:hypothetical protein